jgi:hypothetical protein
MENEVPVDQRVNITKIVQRMMFCREPKEDTARYICPGRTCARTVRQVQVNIEFPSLAYRLPRTDTLVRHYPVLEYRFWGALLAYVWLLFSNRFL